MAGETDLRALVAGMAPTLDPEVWIFATLADREAAVALQPKLLFEEEEGTTVIVPRHVAEAHALPPTFPSRMITLKIHSALEAVGFLAMVASELARHGIGANTVSAFHHDHVFVPEARADEALAILQCMAHGRGSPANASSA